MALEVEKSLPQISAEAIPEEPEEKKTRSKIAKLANVSHDTIQKVKKIKAKATPEQKEKLYSGGKTSENFRYFGEVKRISSEKRKQP